MLKIVARKGISPLIAAVILIAFVVAVANIAGPWFQNFLTGKTSQVEKKSEKSVDCIYANMDFGYSDIESSTNLNSNLVNITLDNSKQEPLYNFTVSYVIDGKGYSGKVIQNQATESDPLKSGSRTTLVTEIQNSSSISGKTLQKVRVSTRVCPGLERTCDLVAEDCK